MPVGGRRRERSELSGEARSAQPTEEALSPNLEVPLHPVVRCNDFQPRLFLQCLCEMVGPVFYDGLAEVRHDRDLGFHPGDDLFEISQRKMFDPVVGPDRLDPQYVDYEDIHLIMIGDSLKYRVSAMRPILLLR